MNERGLSGKRVAFFGGSFDPPHFGHLAIARAARAGLALDTVLFVPVGSQPLKPTGSMASYEDRMAMTALAVSGEAGFEVSPMDAPKKDGKPNYTFDTLLQLRREQSAGSHLYCLMGADSFLNLKSWHRAAEIPFVAPLIVASRPRESMDDLRATLPKGLKVKSGFGARQATRKVTDSAVEVRILELSNDAGLVTPFYLMPGLNEDVSASEIREAVRGLGAAGDLGKSPSSGRQDGFLPDAVLDYIRTHGLYR